MGNRICVPEGMVEVIKGDSAQTPVVWKLVCLYWDPIVRGILLKGCLHWLVAKKKKPGILCLTLMQDNVMV